MSTAIEYLIEAINDLITSFTSMMFYQSSNGSILTASLFDLLLYMIFFIIFMIIFRKVVKHGH